MRLPILFYFELHFNFNLNFNSQFDFVLALIFALIWSISRRLWGNKKTREGGGGGSLDIRYSTPPSGPVLEEPEETTPHQLLSKHRQEQLYLGYLDLRDCRWEEGLYKEGMGELMVLASSATRQSSTWKLVSGSGSIEEAMWRCSGVGFWLVQVDRVLVCCSHQSQSIEGMEIFYSIRDVRICFCLGGLFLLLLL